MPLCRCQHALRHSIFPYKNTHERLVCPSATSNDTDHSTHSALDDLLRTTRKLDTSLAFIRVVADDSHIVAARPAQRTTITRLLLHIRHDGSFWHGAKRKHIPDGELCVLASVDELTGVHALICDEGLGMQLESVWIAEDNFGERCAATWVVDDVLYDTADVAMAFCIVVGSELCWGFVEAGVGSEDAAATLPLIPDDLQCVNILLCVLCTVW